jgi:hypothetical protein
LLLRREREREGKRGKRPHDGDFCEKLLEIDDLLRKLLDGDAIALPGSRVD